MYILATNHTDHSLFYHLPQVALKERFLDSRLSPKENIKTIYSNIWKTVYQPYLVCCSDLRKAKHFNFITNLDKFDLYLFTHHSKPDLPNCLKLKGKWGLSPHTSSCLKERMSHSFNAVPLLGSCCMTTCTLSLKTWQPLWKYLVLKNISLK